MNSLFDITINLAKGAGFTDPPKYNFPSRMSRLVGQTAFVMETTFAEAVVGAQYPAEVAYGFCSEQQDLHDAVIALRRMK